MNIERKVIMGIADYIEQKNRERVRRARAEDAKKISLGILIGGAVGTAAGVLLAPKSGKETRDDISQAAKDAADTIKVKSNDALETAKQKKDQAINKAKNYYSEKVDKNLTNIGPAMEDAKDTFDERMEEEPVEKVDIVDTNGTKQ